MSTLPSTKAIQIDGGQNNANDDIHLTTTTPLSHSSSLCNSVTSLSTASSLSSVKSTTESGSVTSSQSDQTSSSSSSSSSNQSSDHSGKKPILKQPQSQSQSLLLSRSTISTILGGAQTSKTAKKRTPTKTTRISIPLSSPPPPPSAHLISAEPLTTAFESDRPITIKQRDKRDLNDIQTTLRPKAENSNHNTLVTNETTLTGGVNAGGSQRLYKNSPFGLTRHYLSMPGDEDQPVEANDLAGGLHSGNEPHFNDLSSEKMLVGLNASNLINDHHHNHHDKHNHEFAATANCQQHQEKLMMMIPDSASQLAAGLKRASFSNHLDHQHQHHHHHDDIIMHKQQSITGCSGSGSSKMMTTTENCTKDLSSNSLSSGNSIGNNSKHQRRRRRGKSSTLLVKFCSIIYATFLIILGCILHIAELRHKSRNSSDHIYSSVVALIGILWLTFLHYDLQRYKKYACKFILIESIFNDHHQAASSSSGQSLSGQSLDNADKLSMNTEVIFKKTAMHLSSQAAALAAMRQANRRNKKAHHPTKYNNNSNNKMQPLGQNVGQSSPISVGSDSHHTFRKLSTSMLLQHQFDHQDNHHQQQQQQQKFSSEWNHSQDAIDHHQHHRKPSSATSKFLANSNSNLSSSQSIHSSNGDLIRGHHSVSHDYIQNDYHDQLADDDLVPAYRFLHGKMGANFYLKCGMAAFCFGHVIHEGLRFGQQVYFFMTDNYPCQDVAALIAHLITPLYSFYQLFMMFKYSNLVINRFKTVAYFGLMHIIGTSITFWFRTIIEEAFEDFVHKMDYFKASSSSLRNSHILAGGHNRTATIATPLTSLLDAASTLINNKTRSLGSGMMTSANVISGLAARSNSFLDTTPSSLFGLASENNYLGSLLSSLYTGDSHSSSSSSGSSSNLYPDSSIDEMLSNSGDYINHMDLVDDTLGDQISSSGGSSQGVISESIAASLMTLMSSPVSATISPQLASHLPESYACAQNTLLTTKSMNALPYLYPFTIEYNLLLAATFLGLYFNIGRLSSNNCSNHQFRRELVHNHDSGKEELEYKSNFVVNADCHAANKGLFCGFFVLLVTLVSIVIFFVTINKPSHVQLGIKINLIQETTLTCLILLVTLAGFRQIVKLNRNACLKDKVTTDDVLMLVPLPFFFIHSLLSFRAEIALFSNHNHNHQHQIASINKQSSPIIASAILHNRSSSAIDIMQQANRQQQQQTSSNLTASSLANLLMNATSGSGVTTTIPGDGHQQQHFDYFKLVTVSLHVIVMIEVLVQTNFIIDGMRRCSQSRYLRFKKPGRELITFAILLNITYWIVATFESKSVEQYQAEIEFYGPLPWMFVSHTTLPVMLFYRYHSSVCLAEIWGRAYKPAKKVG